MTLEARRADSSCETMSDPAKRDPSRDERGGRRSATLLLAECLLDMLEFVTDDSEGYTELSNELKPKLEGILRGRPR